MPYFLEKFWTVVSLGTPTLGAAVPSALFHVGQEGQELSFILSSFHLFYLVKGHFPGL